MAAVFHDSRRHDWLDTGHGNCVANYYRTFYGDTGLRSDPCTCIAMAYHDMDDADGERAIAPVGPDGSSGLELYRVPKNADTLDKFRLGPGELDMSFLRTDTAHSLVGFAWELNSLGRALRHRNAGMGDTL